MITYRRNRRDDRRDVITYRDGAEPIHDNDLCALPPRPPRYLLLIARTQAHAHMRTRARKSAEYKGNRRGGCGGCDGKPVERAKFGPEYKKPGVGSAGQNKRISQ